MCTVLQLIKSFSNYFCVIQLATLWDRQDWREVTPYFIDERWEDQRLLYKQNDLPPSICIVPYGLPVHLFPLTILTLWSTRILILQRNKLKFCGSKRFVCGHMVEMVHGSAQFRPEPLTQSPTFCPPHFASWNLLGQTCGSAVLEPQER